MDDLALSRLLFVWAYMTAVVFDSQILVSLVSAVLLGGLVGAEREFRGSWAGLRTHMMVAMGSAVFVLVGKTVAGESADLTRLVQGIAAGIGFLGAGAILKLSDAREVRGLTTASSIWLAAAIGVACGFNLYLIAIASTTTTLLINAVVRPLEKHFARRLDSEQTDG